MSFVIYSQTNGHLGTLVSTGEISLEEVIKNAIPNTQYKIVESVNIDNDFFNAYDYDEQVGAKLNIDRAKEIQKNKWRNARISILEQLDVDYIRADEAENIVLKQEIASKKQQLRDITDTLLPDDLEGIKNTWPEILGLKPE